MDCTVGFEVEAVVGVRDVSRECPVCDGTGEVEVTVESYVNCEDCPANEANLCRGHCMGYIEMSGTGTCPACRGYGDIPIVDAECSEYELLESLDSELFNLGDVGIDESQEYCEYEVPLEFRSRVLNPTEDNIQAYVDDVCVALSNTGDYCDADGSKLSGVHVHVRPVGGWTTEILNNVLHGWQDWAEDAFIEEFSPDCARLDTYAHTWESKGVFMPTNRDLCDHQIINKFSYRSFTLNPYALAMHDTIEFRLFDSTTDSDELMKALRWCIAFVQAEGNRLRFYDILDLTLAA